METLQYKFGYCKSIQFLPDISKLNTSKVNDISYLFESCESLKELLNISNWDTFCVNKMNGTFSSCKKLELIPDISNWITYNVQKMKGLFFECHSLLFLKIKSNKPFLSYKLNGISGIKLLLTSLAIFLPDLSKWNNNNVTIKMGIFNECNSLQGLPDISKWNVNNVTNMNRILRRCKSLGSFPDILKWNTNNFLKTANMFFCFSKNAITDSSKWNY